MPDSALQSIIRYIELSQDLATAGQPSEAQLRTIASAGFRWVINLALHDDPRYSLADEAGVVAALGMQYIHIPVQFSAPTLDDLAAFFAAMRRTQGQRVLVHCAHNKRVPVFIALHRVINLRWEAPAAWAEMSQIWQPDARWRAFIEQALAHHGLRDEDKPPASNEGM